MKGLIAALVSTAAAVASGCSDRVCTTEWVYGLDIIVLNDRSGAPICDAAVTARDGSYSETLEPASYSGGGGCHYQGAGERAGTYTVRAEAAGFSPSAVSDLRVSEDGCHVQPVSRTLRLIPTR